MRPTIIIEGDDIRRRDFLRRKVDAIVLLAAATPMLTCLPKSLCSWDYRIRGAAAGDGAVTFNWLSEQGTISLGGVTLNVVKQGWLSGKWTLDSGIGAYATAVKPSALFRSFDVEAGEQKFKVAAASPLGRTFEIATAERKLGTIRPAHPFTRRAFVECDESVSELVQLFAFWLAALTWKRASNNNKS